MIKKQFRMLCLLDIRGYIWTGKKHFCFPVYLVATEASFVSANVTNCAVRYGTLLKCPTISLDIVQQTCFTKYRNEGQKTSLIERIRTVGKVYGFFGLQKTALRLQNCNLYMYCTKFQIIQRDKFGFTSLVLWWHIWNRGKRSVFDGTHLKRAFETAFELF